MRVTVIGAGAVGCYIGGLLGIAGHDVTLLGRPAHMHPIAARGLILDLPEGEKNSPVKAVTDAASLTPADLVLVCVKSADTENAGRELAPALGTDTVILSLQNGVDNAERLSIVTGRPVVPAVVYVGVDMAAPGRVGYHGGGRLLIGPSPQSQVVAAALTQADIPTTVSATVQQALWAKLTVNCAYNALSAVAQIPYASMMSVNGAKEVIEQVVSECQAVAHVCNVTLPANMLQQVLDVAVLMPDQKSSTAQDLFRGRPTEIDFLNGYVVQKGRELNIPTPTNLALQTMVKLSEKNRCVARV